MTDWQKKTRTQMTDHIFMHTEEKRMLHWHRTMKVGRYADIYYRLLARANIYVFNMRIMLPSVRHTS